MSLMIYRMELLRSCLHENMVNANNPFSGTIWDRITKTRFMKCKQYQMAVHDAAAHFNIGHLTTLLMYDKLYHNRVVTKTTAHVIGKLVDAQ